MTKKILRFLMVFFIAMFFYSGTALSSVIPCDGSIGDFVWHDLDRDGIQDDGEPGIAGVTVNLTGTDVAGNLVSMTDVTDDDGEYLFMGLCEGTYLVTVNLETVPSGFEPTTPCSDDQNIDNDSNADGTGLCTPSQTVELDDNQVNPTIDFGFVLPPDCALIVDKKCLVAPQPSEPFECDGKVDVLKMIWDGPGTLQSVTAYRGDVGSETLPADISTEVINGMNRQVVTVSGYQPSTNDVQWAWESDSDSGISQFHLSCSDPEMNGPEDCGTPQGDGKNEALPPAANVWLLDGLATDEGFVLDCTPQPAEGTDQCLFEASPVPGCKTDPGVNDLTSITFRYTGADCTASSNSQDSSKQDCAGDPGADPVSITVIKDDGKTSSDKDSVNVGDTFTLADDFGSESIVAVGGQTLTFHTSCSQPLAVGDVFGSLEVVGINGLGLGAEVTYSYKVENIGDDMVDVTSVFDDKLGELLEETEQLLSGESFTLYQTAFISETTTNKVTAKANIFATETQCGEAQDEVTVTVTEPTCEASIVFEKLDDDKIKWKITNTSEIVATLETFVLDFPASYGVIKEVKLDGTIYKASESSLVVGPGVRITEIDWTQSDVSKRQLDPDETRTLEVVFTQKGDRSGWVGIDAVGGLTFEETCEVEFPDVGGCALGKPTELVFEYTGDACSATTNPQEGSFKCEETGALNSLVSVEMTKDANKFSVAVNGNEVTIAYDDPPGEKMPSEIEYRITGSTGKTQSHTLHTSCSKPLNVDDQFGALILREFIPES